MKKFCIALALFFAAGLCFAQEEEHEPLPAEFRTPAPVASPAPAPAPRARSEFDLEITVGFPVHWTNSMNIMNDLLEEKSLTANTSLGFSLLFNIGRSAGFTLDTDVFFGGKITGLSATGSDHNSLFGFNALLGPVFYIYRGDTVRIPLAVGAHVYYFSDDMWLNLTPGRWEKRWDFQAGPGVYLGIQFHVSSGIYIFSRTTIAVDLFRWYTVDSGTAVTEDSESTMGLAIGWEIKPTIGVGIKF